MNAPNDENYVGLEDMLLDEGEGQKSQFTVGWLLRTIRARKWLIVATALAVLAVTTTQSINDVPIYSTSARIWIKAIENQAAAEIQRPERFEILSKNFAQQVAAQFGMAVELGGTFENYVVQQVFRSFSTSTEPVEASYTLEISGNNRYALRRETALVDSGAIAEIVEAQKSVNGFSFQLHPDYAGAAAIIPFKIKDLGAAIDLLQSKVQLEFTENPATIVIRMEGENPEHLASLVNQISHAYAEGIKLLRKRDTDEQIEVLKGRLAAAEDKYNESAEEFRRFKQRNSLFTQPGIINQKEQLDRLETQLEVIPERRAQLQTLLERLGTDFNPEKRQQEARFVYQSIARFEGLRDDVELQIVVGQLETLEKDWQNEVVATGVNPGHEDYERLNPQIIDAYEKIRKSAESHLAELETEETRLTREVTRQRTRLAMSPEIVSRYDELNQRVAEDLRFRNQLQHDLDAERVRQSVETMSITTFEEAPVPRSPINMDKKKKIALGGLFGLAIGIALALALEFIDKRIKTPDEIKRYLKMQVLGVIPKVDFKDLSEYDDSERARQIDKLLVTHDYSPTPMGEAYRSLRTNLLYSKRAGKIRSLVITSIAPNEGKSFTAANLAIIFAQQKSNTLLVDGDLRRGVLHNTFGCPKSPGLTNYLSGVSHLSEIISETHIPNLSIVSAGSLIPNPSELLGSLQMRRFLEETRRRFDLVIFDSPPLNAATDAIVIGTQVDAVPIVVRASKTNREAAKERLELFRNVPVNVIGIILNDADTYKQQEAYSYYRY